MNLLFFENYVVEWYGCSVVARHVFLAVIDKSLELEDGKLKMPECCVLGTLDV